MKPSILTFIDHYLPGYKAGGPIQTIANLVDHLGSEFNFLIITSDRDSGDKEPYPNVIVDHWNPVGQAKVYYCSPKSLTYKRLARLLSEIRYDLLYLNSFFSPRFTFRPLLLQKLRLIPKRPTIVAPRGELSDGALRIKRIKKQIYIRFAQLVGLYDDVLWQASSIFEEQDIRTTLGSRVTKVYIAADLPPKFPISNLEPYTQRQKGGRLRIVFLSRISPIKNLDFALRTLRRVHAPTDLNIYGNISDRSYWEKCQALIHEMPKHITVTYHGPVDHSVVHDIFAQHDLFFLPTLGENYGHAIIESLSSGTPVLISDRTPWRNLAQAGVGWDLPLTSPDDFAKVIDEYAKLSPEEYRLFRMRAAAYGRDKVCNSQMVDASRKMLLSACSC